jgi:hypothetical protein
LWLCTPWRLLEQLRYSSTHSIPQHWLEISELLQATAALPSKQEHSLHNEKGGGAPDTVRKFQKMRKISRSCSRWNPRNVHPIAQGCMENSYLKKPVIFDKHLFTPELVSFPVFPRSHCGYQIRPYFSISFSRRANPASDTNNFTSAASVCVAANDRANVQLSRSHSGHSTLEMRNILLLSAI